MSYVGKNISDNFCIQILVHYRDRVDPTYMGPVVVGLSRFVRLLTRVSPKKRNNELCYKYNKKYL